MGGVAEGSTYPPAVAYIFIFNLIVGVGSIALPLGFSEAGLIQGLILLALIGFLAYVSATWIIETMAIANAIIKKRGSETEQAPLLDIQNNDDYEKSESVAPFPPSPLVSPVRDHKNDASESENEITTLDYEINQRTEMSLLSEMFLGRRGKNLFYATICIYLYGDLAVYAATVPKSLASVTGGYDLGSLHFTEDSVYYFYLALFSALIVPICFTNFQQTKYLQYATLATRNVSLFVMITLSIIYIGEGNGAKSDDITLFSPINFPSLFGISIYSFMAHHSLPSIILPIEKKGNLSKLLAGDFITIYCCYSLLCVTAVFAFASETKDDCDDGKDACEIQDLYTLNFQSYNQSFIATFLSLFPVFTLSTNYPLISITLRNNLMQLVPKPEQSEGWKKFFFEDNRAYVFSGLSAIPPIMIAFATSDISLLVGVTGSYGGMGIQWVFPALLVAAARKKLKEDYGELETSNPHCSPFVSIRWNQVIYFFSVIAFVVVTFTLIYDIFE